MTFSTLPSGLPPREERGQNWQHEDLFWFLDCPCVEGWMGWRRHGLNAASTPFERRAFDGLTAQIRRGGSSLFWRHEEFIFDIYTGLENSDFCADRRPRKWSISQILVVLDERSVSTMSSPGVLDIYWREYWRRGPWWERLHAFANAVRVCAGEITVAAAESARQRKADTRSNEGALFAAYCAKIRTAP